MGITYHVDASLGVVFEHWQGSITAKEIADHWQARLADQSTRACARTLSDVREAGFPFTGENLAGIIQAILEPALRGRKLETAILVNESVQFGVARQFQAFFEEIGETSVFTDEGSAHEWAHR